ncbi:hypothetical protein BCR32DRAFT_280061 [Anaeromyces robustus]|uniref:Chitin-binding type-1 domain-containing protein n=1 Tax=Anaeromyces robustus TaxID=1754192 RepID=A0A1Y1X5C4_9FUNG|nr:hypothetical protein BCR32DRAFT_280061 [Anaeromyces robustus]|eukprot:ORX81021.1 hypothetical protein BCR32DRAFT_280061 [Anaeromyces robustus]
MNNIKDTYLIKFSVVGFGKTVNVKIGSKDYSLTKINSFTSLYQSTINVDDAVISYKYIVNGIPESFTRTLAKDLPSVYIWTKSVGKGKLFDDLYIPTVHISGKRSETNIPCYPKNKRWNKFQFRVVLNKNGIEGRYQLKFRDNNEDPTFMRQDLYGDIMNVLGYPTIQSVKVRVYVNSRAVGYFILQEIASSESFVRSAFHGNNKGKYLITDINKLGHSFDCATGSDFYYTDNKFTLFLPYNTTPIAMQYLTGHVDSYWFDSTNFTLYNDPTQSTNNTFKFYFICQDWDYTFGVNLGMPYMRYKDFINRSYKDFVNIKWSISDHDSSYRYAIDKLLSNPTLKNRFETILKNTVTKVFNPKVIDKRLDALIERHREEIAWNYDVCNKHPIRKGTGKQYNWSMEDFEENIIKPSSHGAHYGIKQFIYLRAKAIKKEFNLNIDLGDGTQYEFDNPLNYSQNGRCGTKYGKCPTNQCCSPYGYCGNSDAHCGKNCQSEFAKCNEKYYFSNSKKTTKKTSKKTTKKTTKKTKKITTTTTIVTIKLNASIKVSTNGRCDNKNSKCPKGQCCSKYGYCGTSKAYCYDGCQKAFGTSKIILLSRFLLMNVVNDCKYPKRQYYSNYIDIMEHPILIVPINIRKKF